MAQDTLNKGSFTAFIFRDKKNRLAFGLVILLSIVDLFLFKYFWYPRANFWNSSPSFIEAASSNTDVGLWPIGYSRFLGVFHQVTHSDTIVVAFQYFFLMGVMIYFFFTMHYFYSLARNSFNVLFVFLFFDPLFLFLAN